MRTFKAKLQLNKLQQKQIDAVIVSCCELHNEILTLALEQGNVPDYNKLGMFYSLVPEVPAVIAQNQIKHTVQAVKRWIIPDVNDDRLGKPRFKVPKTKTNSFRFAISKTTQYQVKQFGKVVRVHVPKIGQVKGRLGQQIVGTIKEVGIKKDSCGDYWMTIVTDNVRKFELPEPLTETLGVDLGIKSTVSASNISGSVVIQPERKKFLDEKNLAALKWASNTDRKALPFVHRKIARRRDDYNWKLARKVVTAANNIYVGDVSPTWLIRGKLARSASDIALFSLKCKMSYLAASAGRHFEVVNEAYTSKTCSNCGQIKEDLKLSDRIYACSCGFVLDRDLNAARTIAKIGERQRLNVVGAEAASTSSGPLGPSC